TGLDRRVDQNRQRDPGTGQRVEHHRQCGISDGGKGQNRQYVEHEAEQRERGADDPSVATSRRQARHQPCQDQANNPFGYKAAAEYTHERNSALDPQRSWRGVREWVPAPPGQPGGINQSRDARQYLASQRVDPLRQLAKERRARRLFGRGAALRGDKRAQLPDELSPRAVVLQRIDEPLELVDRDRCGLRPWCRRGCPPRGWPRGGNKKQLQKSGSVPLLPNPSLCCYPKHSAVNPVLAHTSVDRRQENRRLPCARAQR